MSLKNLTALKELIRDCNRPITPADRHQILDLIDYLVETPVEVWKSERKVSVYPDCVIKVWGPNIKTEMTDEPRTLQSVQDAIDWLYDQEGA